MAAGGNGDDIGDDIDHGWPVGVELNFVDRVASGKTVPVIDTLSIGPGGALGAMQRAADISGGHFHYLQDFLPQIHAPGPEHPRAQTLEDFEVFVNKYEDFVPVDSDMTWGFGPWSLPWFSVEQGVRELRFTLFAEEPGSRVDESALLDPLGTPVFPVYSGENWAVFKVTAPSAGFWQATWLGDPQDPPVDQRVYHSRAVKHPVALELDVRAVHVDATTRPAELGAQRPGDVLVLRASLGAAGRTGWPMIAVDVIRPDGTTDFVYLNDGGYVDDPAAGDGVFQGTYSKTMTSGAYQFRARANLYRPVLGMLERQNRLSMYLAPAPDGDQDQLPDWWEEWRGTNPTTSDGTSDPDEDGLFNIHEFNWRTDPLADDSDGGGENDGSEASNYHDPLRREDDAHSVRAPHLCAGSEVVDLAFGTPSTTSHLVIRRSLDGDPETTIFDDIVPGGGTFQDAPPLGAHACYRIRHREANWSGENTSAWSPPACARRALDPVAPTLEVRLGDLETTSPSRFVDLHLDSSDDPEDAANGECVALVQETESSGVAEFAVTEAPLTADTMASLQPDWAEFSFRPTYRLDGFDQAGTTLGSGETKAFWVTVRDAAGNLSDSAYLTLNRPRRTALDRGIQAMDDALDGTIGASETAVQGALDEVEAEFEVAVDQLGVIAGGEPLADQLAQTLAEIPGMRTLASSHDWAALGTTVDQSRRRALGTWTRADSLLEDEP